MSEVREIIEGIQRYATEHDDVLHHRPWRKRRDGCEWFLGDVDLRRGGDAPAYKVLKMSQEKLNLFDEACRAMLKNKQLKYLYPAMGDQGSIYAFK